MTTLTGCNTSAIYGDRNYNPPVYWGRHVVEKGDTLYSIAWRYGRDYRELGNANDIDPPYTIHPGEVIRLDRKGRVPANAPKVASRPSSSSGRSRPAPSPEPEPPPKVTRQPDRSADLSTQSQTVSDINWRWPHVGTVIAKYSTSGKVNKGIDIAGNSGDPVRAAAEGNVVYAGNGLLGYGNLIIINHNEHYLSAYAHNRRILVKEGENVKQGQTIAELGSTGTDGNKLHFEIRKSGNPVDPLPYLPPR
ncbi:peptidoglycan DD-metalloendopeptidase family protein [Marinobacter zhanjiangensis]|uniref:Peptidoglycan-binding protein LysM n=1 Tax=Marinobacter zhanjiangensis TaxID=578215 RepID=A0ABQ3ARI1_9GAMM|nr:peptidoglycan DD-metalloendopeptidase family protein [Marinobacter zhanjiangensis]GGY64990.1 peptidoglycan-binding protein LysM [Marinobacter zhanjiangensis]